MQRHDPRRRPQPPRLRARDELARPRAPGTDAEREILAYHYEGKYLNSPNDVFVRSDGTIYFCDPWYGRMPGFGIERERELGWQGVFMIPPGGGQDELAWWSHRTSSRCRTASASRLTSRCSTSTTRRARYIKVFDVAADGTLSNGRLFAEGIGDGRPREGRPRRRDEVRRARQHLGHRPDGVWVFSPEGEHLGVVDIPESVGNLAWGGPDWHTLFVPASTSVYTVTDEGRAPPRALHALRRRDG